MDTTSPAYMQEATVPLGSETHAGEDVGLYAQGPNAHLFRGVQEQHVIYHIFAIRILAPGRMHNSSNVPVQCHAKSHRNKSLNGQCGIRYTRLR